MLPSVPQLLLPEEDVDRAFARLAQAIAKETGGARRIAVVGVQRGGVAIARALSERLAALQRRPCPLGTVDIGLYRDDASTALPDSRIGPSDVPFSVHGADVVLVDDVLQTGRTIRASIDCLLDYGRPRRLWLAVLVDRGGRELPVAPDFTGHRIEVPSSLRVEVRCDPGPPARFSVFQSHPHEARA